MTTSELLCLLCRQDAVSGAEYTAENILRDVLIRELGLADEDITVDRMGNTIATVTKGDGGKTVLLEAHMDEIGFIVTGITEKGFVQFAPVGGFYAGTVLGTAVTVYGDKPYFGAVVTTPPHLLGKDANDMPKLTDMYIDVGLNHDEAEAAIHPGDIILRRGEPFMMNSNRVCGKALDDRAGAATIITAAKEILATGTKNRVVLLFAAQEEVGGVGAMVGGFALTPDESISVDVSFASQPGTNAGKTAALGKGALLGIAPALSRRIFTRMKQICIDNSIPYQVEAMGGSTGTDADDLACAGCGIACGLVSLPQRNMHSPVEICDVRDIEAAARVIALYAVEG